MKLVQSLFLLISLTVAESAPAGPWTAAVGRTDGTKGYGVGAALQANGGYIWIGKTPSSSCPPHVANLNCSNYPGDSTVFTGGNDTVSLAVGVPGGQQVFVAPNGALGYTLPHSVHMPAGSVETGFWRETSIGEMGAVRFGWEQSDFYACPTKETTSQNLVYQVFVVSEATTASAVGCSWFNVKTYSPAATVAWEY